MHLVWIKIFATPLLIAAVTLIARHYGPRVAGILVGLPLTSAPISFFLAAERGSTFAARAAIGAVGGTIGVGAFCVAYIMLARRASWPLSTATGIAFYFVVGAGLQLGCHTLASTFAMIAGYFAFCWIAIPRFAKAGEAMLKSSRPTPPPAWDIPVRMLVATLLVMLLTYVAGAIGAGLSGVLSAFPVFTAILAAFTHSRDGHAAVQKFLCGTIGGTIAATTFFAGVEVLIVRAHLLPTYLLATVAALLAGGLLGRVRTSNSYATVNTRSRAHHS